MVTNFVIVHVEFMIKGEISMKKSELKTGMLVTLRNGEKGMVFRDIHTEYTTNTNKTNDVIICTKDDGLTSWENLDAYNDDLFAKDDEFNWLDIVKVETIYHPYDIIKPLDNKRIENTILNREKRKITIEEIESILGYEIEIVKE